MTKTSKLLSTPNRWGIPWSLKIVLGCISKQPVIKNGEIVSIRGFPLCYHDLYHLEVAKFNRIQIGKHQVSGIHGINAPIFHDFPIVEEYDGILDEVRIAFHEFMVKISTYNTVKAFAWTFWLISQGINPAAVIWRHYRSWQQFKIQINQD